MPFAGNVAREGAWAFNLCVHGEGKAKSRPGWGELGLSRIWAWVPLGLLGLALGGNGPDFMSHKWAPK